VNLLRQPFFSELDSAQNILIAGAGGGYDIFCGLPLYFGLKNLGKNIHLANLSFASLPDGMDRISESLVKVTFSSPSPSTYFPELHLCRWFKERQDERVPIYCFERTGVVPLLGAYRHLTDLLAIDAVILIDGGTDSLLRGDEEGLGTPEEDAASLTAVSELDVPNKLLACLGFGVDHFHGVSHAHFLQAVAELTKADAFLGMFSLTKEMPEVEMYRAASDYVFRALPGAESIVSSSILSAIFGEFGDFHATGRTEGVKLWINPLMSVYWCFRLGQVSERILYREQLKASKNFDDVRRAIRDFRAQLSSLRPAQSIPL
jgi:hypothetical protein